MTRQLIALIALVFSTMTAQAASQLYYIHTDHLGTPQVVTDSDQQVVWEGRQMPFGELHSQQGTITQPLRFPGQYADQETGFSYNYFRDYDASLGRYIQSDPIGLGAGLNTYGYVSQNPSRFVDVFGLVQGSITFDVSGIVGPFGGSRSGGIAFDDEGRVCAVYSTCQTNGEPEGKDGAFGLYVQGGFGASIASGQLCDGSTESTKDSLEGAVFGAFSGSLSEDEEGNVSAAKGVVGLGFGASVKTEQCTTSVHCF
ncbi:RHS repeat domain-containing protein [Marinobacter sp.]|uniref:RHS repeat domain-containing protein n=1 Tax=Marinobacter sp. TaxID=50741 RepID=UPI0034A2CCD4